MITIRDDQIRPPALVPRIGVLLIVVGLVVGLGWVTIGAQSTAMAIGLPTAVGAAIYLISRPLMLLVVMVLIQVSNLPERVGGHGSMLTHASLGLGVASLMWALRDREMRKRINRGAFICFVLVAVYLCTQILAALGSQNADASLTQVRNLASDCLFLVVAVVMMQVTGKPWHVAAAIVVPLAAFSLLCLISQLSGGDTSFGGFASITQPAAGLIETPRYAGPLEDSNFWGRHLVLGLPIAAALFVRARRSGQRSAALGWALSMTALLAGAYLTQSRGTFISIAVVLLVWVVASGGAVRRAGLKSLPLVAVLMVIPGTGNRLIELLKDVLGSDPYRAVDPSVVDRTAAQQVAWAMFRDRPFFGFGPASFPFWTTRYGGTVPTSILSFEKGPNAPHNLYAQLLADAGFVGLLGWVAIMGGSILYLAAKLRRFHSGQSERILCASVLAALIGWSVASIFLHMAYFRTLAIVIALGAAVAAETPPAVRPLRALAAERYIGVLGGVVVGVLVTAGVSGALVNTTFEVSQRVTLLPQAGPNDNYDYALDVRSREVFMPSYAAMMNGGDPGFTARPDPVRGVITVSASSTDKDAARRDLAAAMAQAERNVAHFQGDSAYVVVPLGELQQTTRPRWSPSAVTYAIMAGLLAGMSARVAGRLVTNHGRRRPSAVVGAS